MRIHYRETEEGIEIVRCFGADGNIELPGQIQGRPVTRAAAYAFSARKNQEDEEVLVCETDEGRIFRQQEQLLAGDIVESVRFPDTMREIGKYIFYGCRNLEELTFSDSLTEIGSGAFTGCRSLNRLDVRFLNGRRSCVPDILGDLWQRIDAAFYEAPGGSREAGDGGSREAGDGGRREAGDGGRREAGGNDCLEKRAELVFPEHYEEAVENTPARILFTQHHGSGNNYRQCFYNKEMDYRKYDDLFFVAKAQDKVSVLADLIFGRLLYPAGLARAAEESYEAYVREHGGQIAEYLTDTGRMEALREMSRRELWTKEALDAAVDHAAAHQTAGRGESLSFLMNERHRLFPVRKGKYEL